MAAPSISGTLDATEQEKLFLNRLGTGYSQAALQQLRRVGSPQAWFEAQLKPSRFEENPKVATIEGWFTATMQHSPAQRWQNNLDLSRARWIYGQDMANWSILRRIYSERSVAERMADFWATSLHVPMTHDRAWIWRTDYERVLRTHALGRFEDLLRAASLHPAMLLYLDNYRSVKNNPNENQGRELLELHTVGRASGYTEQMVKDSAKILSGYSVHFDTLARNYEGVYDQTKHTTGAVKVLDFADANAAADGSELTIRYLSYLARHPATAANLARKMATYFVADDASQRLVDKMAAAYHTADTSIPAMLQAMVGDAEFLSSSGKKVRNPIDDLVATARVLEIDVHQAPVSPRSNSDESWAWNANWSHQSIGVFSWPRPDGPSVANAAWATSSRMLGSFKMHWNLVHGWWPKGATYRSHGSWIAEDGVSFEIYVDRLSRRFLGRPASSEQQRAARGAVAGSSWFRTDKPISAGTSGTDGVFGWLGARVIAVLLDSPDHMCT